MPCLARLAAKIVIILPSIIHVSVLSYSIFIVLYCKDPAIIHIFT